MGPRTKASLGLLERNSSQSHFVRISSNKRKLQQQMIKVHLASHRNCKKSIQSESEENWRSAIPDESRALNDVNKIMSERKIAILLESQ